MSWLQALLPPGLFANDLVTNAFVVGTIAAILSAALGYFVVVRRYAFAGHAITDIGLTGGASAALLGLNALWGLLVFCVLAAAGIEWLSRSPRGSTARDRDVATGVILAFALGIGALLLYLGTKYMNEPFTLLFGSIFTSDPSVTPALVAIGLGCLAVLGVLFRPLLFTSIDPETAAARGVPVRLVGMAFLVAMAVGVAETAQVVGVLLSTALLIGPAATAIYLTARPGLALLLGAAIGVLEVWLGIVLSYDSYAWGAGGKGWPVSFFITALALSAYLLARLARPVARRAERRVAAA